MNPIVGILGKHKPTVEDRLAKLEAQIHLLKQRLDVAEHKYLDDMIDRTQLRNALCDAQDAIQSALTRTPFKFTPEQQKVWNGEKKP